MQLASIPATVVRSLAAVALLCAMPACAPSGAAEAEGAGTEIDVDRVLAALSDYPSSGDFELINVASYPSAVAAGSGINVWVSAPATASYATIDPEVEGSGVRLPEGTLIIREVLDATGTVKKLTLMGKGPSGYNPEIGDWWFGVATPDGNLRVEKGQEQIGRLSNCYGCHLPRAADDFLFGVPALAKDAGGDDVPGDEDPGEEMPGDEDPGDNMPDDGDDGYDDGDDGYDDGGDDGYDDGDDDYDDGGDDDYDDGDNGDYDDGGDDDCDDDGDDYDDGGDDDGGDDHHDDDDYDDLTP